MVIEQKPGPTLGGADPTQATPGPDVDPDLDRDSTTTVPEGAETPGKGEDETPSDEQRPELPEGWRDHDQAKAHRQEGHSEGFQQAQGQFEKAHQRELRQLRAEHQEGLQRAEQAATSNEAVSRVTGAAQAFMDEIEKGASAEDAEKAMSRLLRNNADWARVFSGTTRQAGHGEGYNQGIAKASGLIYEGLPKEAAEELGDLTEEMTVQVQEGTVTREVAFGKLLAKRDELIRTDEAAKLGKLRTEREAQEGRAQKRNGQPVPAEPAGSAGGGGRSEDEILMDPETPITRIKEIVARRKGAA
jgi:hypothetical protein